MSEWVYRVTGVDGYTGDARDLYVRAGSLAEALRCAAGRGVTGATGQHVDESEVPFGISVILANAAPEPVSDLQAAPVWTIAKGVFVGLLLWSIFCIAITIVLVFLGVIAGF